MTTIKYVERCTHCGSLTVGDLVVDVAMKEIRFASRVVTIRPKHALLAERLVVAGGRVVRHEQLIDHVWGDDADGGPDDPQRAIFVGVVHLRRALAELQAPLAIETVHAVGYRLVAIASGDAPAVDQEAETCPA